MTSKKYPKDDLLDLINDDHKSLKLISNTFTGKSRWCDEYDVVFQDGDKFYMTGYRTGSTENCDERPWEHDGPEIECMEVVPREKTMIEYVPAQ